MIMSRASSDLDTRLLKFLSCNVVVTHAHDVMLYICRKEIITNILGCTSYVEGSSKGCRGHAADWGSSKLPVIGIAGLTVMYIEMYCCCAASPKKRKRTLPFPFLVKILPCLRTRNVAIGCITRVSVDTCTWICLCRLQNGVPELFLEESFPKRLPEILQ